jgi:hypothetical protein
VDKKYIYSDVVQFSSVPFAKISETHTRKHTHKHTKKKKKKHAHTQTHARTHVEMFYELSTSNAKLQLAALGANAMPCQERKKFAGND